MRRAIAEGARPEAKDAIFYFFGTGSTDVPRIEALDIKPSGSISKWPQGFFDQIEIDLAALADTSRRR